MKKIVSTLFIFILFSTAIYGQRTQIYHPHIQTVQTIVNDNYTLPAIIQLGSDDFINISFDQLSHDANYYKYKISHCDANWQSSDLSDFDFIDGFNDNYLEDYESSMNTTVPYTHSQLTLPNDQIRFTISGTHKLTIYNEDYRMSVSEVKR